MMTEKAYVGSLKILIEEFQRSMIKAATEGRLRGKEDAQSIIRLLKRVFCNVEEILGIQQETLQKFVAEFNKWPGPMSVTQIFVDLAPKLRSYSTYVNNYDSAIEALATLNRTTNFREIHSEIQRRPNCNLGLEMLLIMPVQRIPRYELLLKQLQKLTSPEHRDAATLPSVIKIIEDTATHINEEKRKSETKEQLYSLQRKIKDCPDLLVEGRTLVYKGKLNTFGTRLSAVFKNKRAVYLFTDIVIVTAQTLSGQFCEDFSPLKDVQVVDSVEEGQFVVLFLSSTGRTRRRYQFTAENDTTKAYWLQQFSKFTAQNRRNTQEFIESMSQQASALAAVSSGATSPQVRRALSNPAKVTAVQSSSSSPNLAVKTVGVRPPNQVTAGPLKVTAASELSSPQPQAPPPTGPVRSASASSGLNVKQAITRPPQQQVGSGSAAPKVSFQMPYARLSRFCDFSVSLTLCCIALPPPVLAPPRLLRRCGYRNRIPRLR